MVTYQNKSVIGDRSVNEDCTGMHQVGENYGFFLADGLGGHGKGDVASSLAVKQAIMQFELGGASKDTLARIFEAGQEAIMDRQREEDASMSMKTTMTALLIGEKQIFWGHIGDSRIYYFLNDKMVCRTTDHSVPQMMVAAGEIKESEIRRNPDRNRLLRVMGMEWDHPLYQLAEPIKREGHQAFLMCSDGFWDLVNEKEMLQTLRHSSDVSQWADSLMKTAESNGADYDMDNCSIQAVWVE